MGNALWVYESRYGVKKAKSLILREIFRASELAKLQWSHCILTISPSLCISFPILTSLSFPDLSVSVGAMVFNAILVILQGHWVFSMWLCDVYNAMDVVFSTASILNLFCISMYRWVKLSVKYAESSDRQGTYFVDIECSSYDHN